jgi:lipid-A-disaccharide synthase
MQDEVRTYRILLSAAEPSGDAYCAGLITALKQKSRNIEFVGVGGPKMEHAGCDLLENTVDRAAMIYKAFGQVGYYYAVIRRISRFLKSNKIDLAVVCDSPSFNFHIAKAAKKAGTRTLFYVAPQLWAWAGWRIHKLRRYCDKLCCILPFEEEWFGRRDIDVTFVGHPLLDDLPSDQRINCRRTYANFDPQTVKVALMPGSRVAEIESLWRPMQQIALQIKQEHGGARFVTVAVDGHRQEELQAQQIADFECQYSIDSVSDTAAACDFTVVTSGSATLQVAAVGCPMVILYQSSRILWHLLGRRLVRTEYLSLVNILAGRELVPEYMPYFTSIEPIVQDVARLFDSKDTLAQISRELVALTEPLAKKKAREEVADTALAMLR